MKPYCDRPQCVRQFTHEHAAEAPETALSDSLSPSEPVSSRHTPGNGREAENRSEAEELLVKAFDLRKRHDAPPLIPEQRKRLVPTTSAPPESEDKGGALPEVEAGSSETSPFAAEWEALSVELATLEAKVGRLHQERKQLVGRMRDAGLSFGEIAAVTGISRQRVSQIAARP